MHLFTDGSCQKAGSSAAFIVKNPRRTETLYESAEVLPKGSTNQYAELRAIEMALQWRRTHGCKNTVDIVVTDSQYSIDCVTKWSKTWKKNNWKTSNNTDVKHRNVIESIMSLMDSDVQLVHVRSHTKKHDPLSIGNEQVDRLANSVLHHSSNG